jgi:hypothetical protein
MIGANYTKLSNRALHKIRSSRGSANANTAKYSVGGIPKSDPKPPPKITLRRKDYEREKAGK